ncbi:uroporphyrinogen-III synthase [Heyndrickxia sporothermodurans]
MSETFPLNGQSILVTRGGEKGMALANKISQLGGHSHMVPLIDFKANHDPNAVTFLNKLHLYDWIIFTSQNGVQFFFNEVQNIASEIKLADLKTRIAAVGSKTKDAIEKYNVKVDFYPTYFSAADFVKQFIEEKILAKRVLLPKGNLASDTIKKGLEAKNILVDEWIVYNTFFPPENKEKLLSLLREKEINFATFTSPSTFHHFMEVVNEHSLENHLKNIRFITIGAVTKKAIENYGYTVAASPEVYTMDSMIDSLCSLTNL